MRISVFKVQNVCVTPGPFFIFRNRALFLFLRFNFTSLRINLQIFCDPGETSNSNKSNFRIM